MSKRARPADLESHSASFNAPILKKMQTAGTSLPAPSVAHHALRRVFGLESFRGLQEDIISALTREPGSDALCILPTGAGKSLLYALPAVLSRGVTVVVSPLLALTLDQVSGLVSARTAPGAASVPAAATNSEQAPAEAASVLRTLEAMTNPGGDARALKLWFLTPESLLNRNSVGNVLDKLAAAGLLARLVVDEAHACSEFGHDFRLDYGRLGFFRKAYPRVPITALTATATPRVASDIRAILGMSDSCPTWRAGVDRPNLIWCVRPKALSPAAAAAQVLAYVRDEQAPGARGIVYVLSREEAEATAAFLAANGLAADAYHAGMTKSERLLVQAAWRRGDTAVVCATIAFGMGIDATVRYVVHLTLPKSVEGLYQEAGRAGRDGERAHCLLLYHPRDVARIARMLRTSGGGAPKRSRGGNGNRGGTSVNRTTAAAAKRTSLRKLEVMQAYAEDSLCCRRLALVRYFNGGDGSSGGSGGGGVSALPLPPSCDVIVRCDAACDVCWRHSAIAAFPPRLEDRWLCPADATTGRTVAEMLGRAPGAMRRVAGASPAPADIPESNESWACEETIDLT